MGSNGPAVRRRIPWIDGGRVRVRVDRRDFHRSFGSRDGYDGRTLGHGQEVLVGKIEVSHDLVSIDLERQDQRLVRVLKDREVDDQRVVSVHGDHVRRVECDHFRHRLSLRLVLKLGPDAHVRERDRITAGELELTDERLSALGGSRLTKQLDSHRRTLVRGGDARYEQAKDHTTDDRGEFRHGCLLALGSVPSLKEMDEDRRGNPRNQKDGICPECRGGVGSDGRGRPRSVRGQPSLLVSSFSQARKARS